MPNGSKNGRNTTIDNEIDNVNEKNISIGNLNTERKTINSGIRAAAIHSIKGGYSMRYLHEIALYFNTLSDKADEIRKLDRDHYKHHSDMEILEEVLNDKIESLKSQE
jgi:hypothetical protein